MNTMEKIVAQIKARGIRALSRDITLESLMSGELLLHPRTHLS